MTNPRSMCASLVMILLCSAAATRAKADKPIGPPPPPFNTLASFTFNGVTGSGPVGSLVQGTDGNFYGVTSSGGQYDQGAIFSIGADGVLTTLHSFNGTDGYNLVAGLTLGADGNFYGTATNGGNVLSGSCDSTNGELPGICGTVFKITPDGVFSVIYNFDGTHGSYPEASLTLGFDGNLYGTTEAGGTYGMGTIFKITPAGKISSLYSFCAGSSCPDGTAPSPGPLVQGTDGNFYGTTLNGGAGSNCLNVFSLPVACGTVFKYTPGGAFTTLHTFCLTSCTDGQEPYTGLILGPDGAFYGSTPFGGAGGGGTVFKITSSGTLSTVYSFCVQAACDDAAEPGPLLLGSDGNFYGTTSLGGGNIDINSGTLYQLTPAGVLTTLHIFDYITDGIGGLGLTQSTNGILFGLAVEPAQFGGGNIFTYDEGLSPFIETLTPGGNAGSSVLIFGTAVEDGTSVKFNGTSAAFDILSDQEIEATVPKGATTGIVSVPILDGLLGSLKTKVPFTTPIP